VPRPFASSDARARLAPANPALLFAPAVVVLLLIASSSVRDPYWMGVVTTLCLTCVAVLGLDLLFGWAGQFSFASGPLFVMGGYSQAILTTTYELDPVLALLATTAVVVVVSLLLGGVALRVSGFVYGILTVFVALLFPAFLIAVPDVTGGGDGLPVGQLTVAGLAVTTPEGLLLMATILLGVAYVAHMLFLCGKWGIRWRSLASSPVAHEVTGNSRKLAVAMAFIASALFVGLAGAGQAYYTGFMSPEAAGLHIAVAVLLAAILGGLGSYVGALLGTAVVFGLPLVLSTAISLQEALYAGAVLFVIALLPEGLASLGRITLSLLPGRARAAATQAAARPDLERLRGHLAAPRRSPGEHRLEVRGASKSFAGVTALESCSLAVAPGAIVGIVGPNGSGKSTLLNVISGIVRSDAGSVQLGERDITRLAIHRRARLGIARTFQVPALPSRLKVWQVVALARARDGKTIRRAKRESLELLEMLGLGGAGNAVVRELPHAQHRLISIAQALATDPDFLLLDEPVAGTTEEEAEVLAQVLVTVAGAGIGVMVVEHHLDWLAALADRVVVLQAGEVVDDGAPADVKDAVDTIVRGRPAGAAASAAPAAAAPPAADRPPALEVEGLTAGHGGAPVFRDATLEVPRGGLVGLVGPNGAGKTTLLHAVAGLLPATGRVSVHGERVDGQPVDRRTRKGLVLAGEGRPLFRNMTVRENLELSVIVEGVSGAERTERLERVLGYFEVLGDRLGTPAGNLSGGQQQMLLLACCFAKQPRVLLVDEPTLGLAESVAEELWSTLLRLCRDEAAVSVLVADEEAERVTRSADLIYEIEAGRLSRRFDRPTRSAEPVRST
jgi:branched-chain amino acid transport system ATP-binding protein